MESMEGCVWKGLGDILEDKELGVLTWARVYMVMGGDEVRGQLECGGVYN